MSEGTRIQAVVFDLDDTLYPERQYVRSGYCAVARRLREHLGRDDRFEDWMWDRFCRGETDRAFDAVNEQFDLGLDQEQIGRLVEVYRTHEPDIQPYEGVPELLGRLRQLCVLGLLSDGYLPAQQLKLDALGIGEEFDEVLFTEALGREFWKPSPRGFALLAERLEVEQEACAYVADNPTKDFVGPNSLGWCTVHYIRPEQIYTDRPVVEDGEPSATVEDDEQLLSALGLHH